MSSDREIILSRVRAALAPLPARAPLPNWEDELVKLRQLHRPADLWTLFAERLQAAHGIPLASAVDLGAWLETKGLRHGYCDPALWSHLQRALPGSIKVETTFARTRVDEYQFGITRADGAIAETGTIILKDSSTPSRLAALAPWVHIAVLRRADIFADLAQAVSAFGDDSNVIWVTGPSKTADVEGILIEGVHGPGVQIGLLIS